MQEKKCRDLSFGWKMNKSLQIIVVNFLRGHLKKKFPGDTLKKKNSLETNFFTFQHKHLQA